MELYLSTIFNKEQRAYIMGLIHFNYYVFKNWSGIVSE